MTGVRLQSTVLFGIGVVPLVAGALARGGSFEETELRRTAVWRRRWAWTMEGVQVCRCQIWKGAPGPPRTEGSVSLCFWVVSVSSFCVFLPSQVGQDGSRGLKLGISLPQVCGLQ